MSSADGTSAQKKQLALMLQRAQDASVARGQQRQGQGLPCHVVARQGAIVTVAFDVASDFTLPNVTCPIAESEYVLLPIQIGDKGFVTSAVTRLGGASGLGSGVAPLAMPGNLGGLVFVPLGNTAWDEIDANAVIVQGPNGVVARTMDGASVVTINGTTITLQQGSATITLTGGILAVNVNTVNVNAANSTFSGNVTVGGMLTVDGAAELGSTMAVAAAVTMSTTLSVDGKDFSEHEHLSGTYKVGSNPVTGDSGGVA